ncbi:Frigida-like [Parasponia andersonii]|uniref:FRIGIDA-like protein n=1 Tax=Parasponia andersonii TaxID=3476 RepID=A0A2P5DKY2_PARAD|nr:Frigida-like [Parasponia andersonii]
MSTTVERVSPEIEIADSKRPQIRKAFNFLKAHASAVANFTLQWQDLEDHFQSINSSIQSKLYEIEQSQKPQNTRLPQTQESQPNSKKVQVEPTLESQIDSEKTQLNSTDAQSNSPQTQLKSTDTQLNTPKTQVNPQAKAIKTQVKSTDIQSDDAPKPQVKPQESLAAKVGFKGDPVHDGKALIDYLKYNLKDHESVREDVRDVLKGFEDSGKLVLEAIKGFHSPELKIGVVHTELSCVRRGCVVLLEELIKVRPLISGQVKEEACKLASAWETKMKPQMVNSMEIWGFLLVLDAYGLVDNFDRDEILKFVGCVVQRRLAPEMFRSLGLSENAPDFIQNLILQDKVIEATRFICTLQLADKFPPVPLLKAHLKEAKKVASSILKKSNSPEAKDDAANKELSALNSIVRCIEEYKLESEYPPENLKERIDLLRKQKRERRVTPTAPAPKAQVQQQSGKKRTFPDSNAQTKKQQSGSKHPRTAPAAAATNLSARAPTTVHLHHSSEGMFGGERTEYLMPSVRMAAPLNVSARVAPVHAVHQRPEGFVEGERTEYLIPSARIAAPSNASARVATGHAVHQRPERLYERESTEYLIRSARMAVSASAAAAAAVAAAAAPPPPPNPSFGAASNLYCTEVSHQPAASYTGQGTEYTSRYYNLARAILDSHTSLPSGSHGLVRSPPVTQLTNLASGVAYSLTSSILEDHRMSSAQYGVASSGAVTAPMTSSAEQYGTGVATSGRIGPYAGAAQAVGVTSNVSPRSSLAYYPGDPLRVPSYNDRLVSSSSGYEALPKRPPVFHM